MPNNPGPIGEDVVSYVDNNMVTFDILDAPKWDRSIVYIDMDKRIRERQVAMLVFSLTSESSLDPQLRNELRKVCRAKGTWRCGGADGLPRMPIVVCGTKADLEEERVVSREAGEAFAKRIRAPYFETSATAKNLVNVEEAFHQCARELAKYEYLEKAEREEAVRRRIVFVWCALRSTALPLEIVTHVVALVDWGGGIEMDLLEAMYHTMVASNESSESSESWCAVQ
eukprot:TRINITY_DN1457_c0_g4_i2.p1 TRINITY_DN1457_c0_g4~~TRINITY_DN1457_c0_g4_i2.p1  ORF type:complete len:227 (+),score=49.01 TRINITY_DN1457_c0_g4_i2:401-1081(+)